VIVVPRFSICFDVGNKMIWVQAGKSMAKIDFLEIKNHPKQMQLKNEGLTAWVAL
jgi:hypothetical protein